MGSLPRLYYDFKTPQDQGGLRKLVEEVNQTIIPMTRMDLNRDLPARFLGGPVAVRTIDIDLFHSLRTGCEGPV